MSPEEHQARVLDKPAEEFVRDAVAMMFAELTMREATRAAVLWVNHPERVQAIVAQTPITPEQSFKDYVLTITRLLETTGTA